MTRLAGGGSATGVSSGSVDGIGSAALFNAATCIAVTTSGTMYVADYGNHLIRAITPTGTIIADLEYLLA